MQCISQVHIQLLWWTSVCVFPGFWIHVLCVVGPLLYQLSFSNTSMSTHLLKKRISPNSLSPLMTSALTQTPPAPCCPRACTCTPEACRRKRRRKRGPGIDAPLRPSAGRPPRPPASPTATSPRPPSPPPRRGSTRQAYTTGTTSAGTHSFCTFLSYTLTSDFIHSPWSCWEQY